MFIIVITIIIDTMLFSQSLSASTENVLSQDIISLDMLPRQGWPQCLVHSTTVPVHRFNFQRAPTICLRRAPRKRMYEIYSQGAGDPVLASATCLATRLRRFLAPGFLFACPEVTIFDFTLGVEHSLSRV